MKKGNIFPQARAKWMTTADGFYRQQPPVWCKPFELAVVLVVEVLGVPVPINIAPSDCSPGLWRYNPNAGRIIWKGEWATLVASGDWYIKQQMLTGEYVEIVLTLTYELAGVVTFLSLTQNPLQLRGVWTTSDDYTVYGYEVADWTPPWVPTGHFIWKPVTYADLRADGIDPDNTEPQSWTSSL